ELDARLIGGPYKEVHISLDPCADGGTDPDVLRVALGPPVLSWSVPEMADPQFAARAYSVLKPHIQAAKHNRVIRPLGLCDHVNWVTGQPPETSPPGWSFHAGQGCAAILTSMIPAFRALAEEISGSEGGQSSSIPAIMGFFRWMRQQGVDPDPGNLLLMTMLQDAPGHERPALKQRLRRLGWESAFHGADVSWRAVSEADELA